MDMISVVVLERKDLLGIIFGASEEEHSSLSFKLPLPYPCRMVSCWSTVPRRTVNAIGICSWKQ